MCVCVYDYALRFDERTYTIHNTQYTIHNTQYTIH
jgi:hypothetical protein